MTTEQKLAIKEKIEKVAIENYRAIRNYKERLDDNFLYNFEWCTEKLFKAKWIVNICDQIVDMIDKSIENNDDTNITKCIENMKERFRNDLLSRTLMASSTNPLHNLSTLWINECKQELIEIFPSK